MLNDTLDFLRLLREFEKVERTVHRPNDKRENDCEHSYQVAMLAWYLVDYFNLSLSKEKLFKYGLAHDLVEAYAGDTCAFKKVNINPNTIDTKKEREEKAFNRIKKEFGDFKDLIQTIEDYENKVDPENVFIYEIDKILPALNIYVDDGYGWNKLGLTLDEIKEEKRSKVKKTKELKNLLEELLERFEKEWERLFEN